MRIGGVRQVVVIGAGMAGQACALACATAGLSVTLVDARLDLASEVGIAAYQGHVDLVPNLWRDLVALGLREPCQREGFPYSAVDIVDTRGHTLFQLEMPALAGRHLPRALGIGGDRLSDIFGSALLASDVHWMRGSPVTGLGGTEARPCIQLESGQQLEADLLLLASGAASALRNKVFAAAACPPVSPAWMYALMPRPSRLDKSTWIIGPNGLRIQLVPVDTSRAGIAVAAPLSVGAPNASSMTRLLHSHAGLPRELASAIPSSTQVYTRTSQQGLLAEPWHRAGILAVGDCAHALPPYFEQAAAQAIEDAVVLRELIREELPRDTLLERFMLRRGERVRTAHALTLRAARWMGKPQADTDFSALVQDLASMAAMPA